MPTRSESVRPNLEFYRKQAKALLKSAKSGDPAALQRIELDAQHNPANERLALHHAQLAIAREQGFLSWPRFKAFIATSRLDPQDLVKEFVSAALSDRKRAEELLAKAPGLAGAGIYAALVLGECQSLREALAEIPGFAAARSGPENLEPLLYVAFSRFAGRQADAAPRLVEAAKILLAAGASPDASFTPADLPGNPLSALYGASGVNNNPALTRALLEAGANPNDSESLYHSTEHPDLECMKLLLAHGATPGNTNALKHMLDREDLEGLLLLLEAGADPGEVNAHGQTALHWAVWRGRSAQIISALLDHGAPADARGSDGRSAYALARSGGQLDVARLLESRGATMEMSALDRFLADCAAAEPGDLERRLASAPDLSTHPESHRLLPDLASRHSTAAVRGLLAARVPVDARGDMGATALHWACWKGYADLAGLLLGHGASLTVEDRQYGGTPPGWFAHGIKNCCEGGADYPGVARLLLAAGAQIPPADLPTGNAEVDEVLRAAGQIR